jgi:hypothetical protein
MGNNAIAVLSTDAWQGVQGRGSPPRFSASRSRSWIPLALIRGPRTPLCCRAGRRVSGHHLPPPAGSAQLLGNPEDLAPCGSDATPDTSVRRTQAARSGCGDTGSDDGGLLIGWTGSPSALVITGDIDEFTYLRLTAALVGLADRDGDIHLDLAAVQYCDLAGLRTLIRLGAGDDDRPDH